MPFYIMGRYEEYVNALESKNPKTRNNACFMLATLGDKRAVKPLINMLKDPDVTVRITACKSLGKLDKKHPSIRGSIRESLRKLLEDKEGMIRENAALVLGEFGNETELLPLALRLKSDANQNVRDAAKKSLITIVRRIHRISSVPKKVKKQPLKIKIAMK
jgi:HEAT repeat protein